MALPLYPLFEDGREDFGNRYGIGYLDFSTMVL
jgi:hypothetical protein